MYNYQGKPTAYSQLPSNVQRAVTKTQRTPTQTQTKSYSKKITPREQLRKREQMYQSGYTHLTPLELARGGGALPSWVRERQEKEAVRKSTGFVKAAQKTYSQQQSPEQIGNIRGTTFDQRLQQGQKIQYEVIAADGTKNIFDSQQAAEKYAAQSWTTTTKYQVVDKKGVTKSFNTKESAEKYAATQGKTSSSFVGFSPSGEPIQGAPKPEYVTVEQPKEGDKYQFVNQQYKIQQGTVKDKPLSSTGERLQKLMGWLEEEQKKSVKNDPVRYYKGVGGVPKRIGGGGLAAMGFEVAKDTLAGAAYLENIFYEGEAKVRGGQLKTSPIEIPQTGTGVVIQSAMELKSPKEISRAASEYEKTYGRGTVIAGFAGAALIPVPLPKGIKIFAPITKSARAMKIVTAVGEKVQIAKVKNVLAQAKEVVVTSQQRRIVKKYAKERLGDEVYGIRKIGKNVYAIDPGFEESGKVISGGIKPKLVGFTKYFNDKYAPMYKVFSKVPKKQVMPKAAKVSETPLIIVEFGKEYIKKGKTLIQKVEPFEKVPAMKLPVMKKISIGKTIKKSKPFNIVKSMGLNLKLVKPKNLKSSLIKSMGLTKKVRPKSKIVKVTEVTDYSVPEQVYQTFRKKRVLITSADLDFAKQTNQLRLTKISRFAYQGQMSSKLIEAEKLGLVKLTAVGKTAPLKVLKMQMKSEKNIVKNTTLAKARDKSLKLQSERLTPTLREKITNRGSQMRDYISGKTSPTPLRYISQKIGKKIAREQKSEIPLLNYIGTKAIITKVYQTSGLGLGQSKGFIARTKQKELIGVGSKDLDRKLESVGLGEKRKFTKQVTPYNAGAFSKATTGTGRGKAQVLSREAQESIIGSYEQAAKKINENELKITGKMTKQEKKLYYKNIAEKRRIKLDKAYPNLIGAKQENKATPTNYLQTKSTYKPREKSQEELYNTVQVKDGLDVEEIVIRYPERTKYGTVPRLSIKSNLGLRQESGLASRQESRLASRQESVLVTKQQNVLDTSQVTKARLKIEPLMKRDNRVGLFSIPTLGLKTNTETELRTRQITLTTPVTKQITTQRQELILKTDVPEITRTKLPPGILIPTITAKRKTKKEKAKPEYSADFLGAASEYSVFGLTGREDVTYGLKRIERLSRIDRRKSAKTPAMNNPEGTKLNTKRKKKTIDQYSFTNKRGSVLVSTKLNLFGKNRKVKF